MREAVLKLEVSQYVKAEAQLVKEDLRDHIRQDLNLFRNDIRLERRAFYAKVFVVAAFLIGGDAWTMWGVYQHVQQVLQTEIEKNRMTFAAVLGAETKKIHDQIQVVKNDLTEAQKVAAEAQIKAASASKLADESIRKITEEHNLLTAQIAPVERQLANAREISTQLDFVKKQLVETSTALKKQQGQLSETSELVKMLFSKGQSDMFDTAANNDNLLALPILNRQLLQTLQTVQKPNQGSLPQVLIFLRLRDAPIPQTLQLQYFVAIQPRASYAVLEGVANVVIFRWGDSLDALSSASASSSMGRLAGQWCTAATPARIWAFGISSALPTKSSVCHEVHVWISASSTHSSPFGCCESHAVGGAAHCLGRCRILLLRSYRRIHISSGRIGRAGCSLSGVDFHLAVVSA
jgi:hypothetical protein